MAKKTYPPRAKWTFLPPLDEERRQKEVTERTILTYRHRPSCLLKISTVFISAMIGRAVPTGLATASGKRPKVKQLNTYDDKMTMVPTNIVIRALKEICGIHNTALLSILAKNERKTKGIKTRSSTNAPKNKIGTMVPLLSETPPPILQ